MEIAFDVTIRQNNFPLLVVKFEHAVYVRGVFFPKTIQAISRVIFTSASFKEEVQLHQF